MVLTPTFITVGGNKVPRFKDNGSGVLVPAMSEDPCDCQCGEVCLGCPFPSSLTLTVSGFSDRDPDHCNCSVLNGSVPLALIGSTPVGSTRCYGYYFGVTTDIFVCEPYTGPGEGNIGGIAEFDYYSATNTHYYRLSAGAGAWGGGTPGWVGPVSGCPTFSHSFAIDGDLGSSCDGPGTATIS